jgi:hypothetical protein
MTKNNGEIREISELHVFGKTLKFLILHLLLMIFLVLFSQKGKYNLKRFYYNQ